MDAILWKMEPTGMKHKVYGPILQENGALAMLPGVGKYRNIWAILLAHIINPSGRKQEERQRSINP